MRQSERADLLIQQLISDRGRILPKKILIHYYPATSLKYRFDEVGWVPDTRSNNELILFFNRENVQDLLAEAYPHLPDGLKSELDDSQCDTAPLDPDLCGTPGCRKPKYVSSSLCEDHLSDHIANSEPIILAGNLAKRV